MTKPSKKVRYINTLFFHSHYAIFFLIIKIKIILRGINKTHVPVFLTVPYSKPLGLEKSEARITCAISCNLYLTRPPNTSGRYCKIEYITVYASENIVPISATIPILIAESFSLDFNIGDTAAIAAAPHTPVPIIPIIG